MKEGLSMIKAYLGLGSNLGNREKILMDCVEQLKALDGVKILCASRFYETEPVGPPQPGYLNAAVSIETSLSPQELLKTLQGVESSFNRLRTIKWGPRTLDIDILLYDDKVVNDADLIIPHPMVHKRSFVLEPLAEIAPEARHPILKKTIAELLTDIKGKSAKCI